MNRYFFFARTLLPLSVVIWFGNGAPALALVINSQLGETQAEELDIFGNIVGTNFQRADTSAGGPADSKVTLGDGTNAFALGTFAEAFDTFRNGVPTYWVGLNADNTLFPAIIGGAGFASVQLSYSAIKEHNDQAFTLNFSGGALRLVDPDAGSAPLSAKFTLEAIVSHGSSILMDVLTEANLHGNGGTFLTETFDMSQQGLDLHPGAFVLEDDGGNNVVGAHVEIPAMKIPVNIGFITDGTPINIGITLTGEVHSPGGETEAQLFIRDPAHFDDPDPLAGGSTLTFDTASPGVDIPEPSSMALLAPALLIGVACFWRRCALALVRSVLSGRIEKTVLWCR